MTSISKFNFFSRKPRSKKYFCSFTKYQTPSLKIGRHLRTNPIQHTKRAQNQPATPPTNSLKTALKSHPHFTIPFKKICSKTQKSLLLFRQPLPAPQSIPINYLTILLFSFLFLILDCVLRAKRLKFIASF